jgi:hypothetical protein
VRITFQDDLGRVVGTYIGGQLYPSPALDREKLAFMLFQLSFQLMGGFAAPTTAVGVDITVDNVEGGSP